MEKTINKRKTIFLLRHGDAGYQGKYIGTTDASLSRVGRQQIHNIREGVRKLHIDKVLCSPQRRCLQTLNILDLGYEIEIVDKLREIDFGRWEALSFEEIAQADPDLLDQWILSPDTFIFPEGDSISEFRQRITEVAGLLQETYGDCLLLVTHGGVIRHLLCTLLGLDYSHYLAFSIQTGGIAAVDMYKDGGVLQGLNINYK